MFGGGLGTVAAMADLDAIFKAYDVRGIYPDQIDADVARRTGAAFAAFMQREDPALTTVVVGNDMRPSGVELVAAFNDAQRKVETTMKERFAGLAGGMNLPPGMNLPF